MNGTALAPPHVGLAESGNTPDGGIYSASAYITPSIGNISYELSASEGYTNYDLTPVVAYGDAQWLDSITLASATLPIGTPVQMQLSNPFAGFTAQLDLQVGGTQNSTFLGDIEAGATFSVQPEVDTDSGFLSQNNPTSTTTVTDNFSNYFFAHNNTTEMTATYATPPTFTEHVGDQITVSVHMSGSVNVISHGLAFGNPNINAPAYTSYPYSFTVLPTGNAPDLTGAAALPGATPDVSLIDANGHNWLTPVSGLPTTPIDPFSFSFGAPVPEASTTVSLGLLAFGLGGLMVSARRRKE